MNELQILADEVRRSQRTQKGLAYEKMMKAMAVVRSSPDPRHRDVMKANVEEMLALKSVGSSSVHSNTFLSNMSVQYKNDDYIGEQLVGLVPVDKRSNTYAIYPKRERLAYPDDAIGARSTPNELNESRTSDSYLVKDYGYQNFVSEETVDNEDAIFDEMMDLVEAINEGIAFRRELRVASALTTAGNFSGNTVTLSGSDQWDSAAGGNPTKDIQTAKAAIWEGRGPSDLVGYCSLAVFNCLARHPTILDNLKYTRAGLVQRAELASYFGLTDLLVGASRKDTANEGQTASYSRIWGLHFGIVRVSRRATRRNAAFGTIFRLNGDPVTTQWFDQRLGKIGGNYAKVGVSEDLKVVAGDTGYLIVNATSA